ncbi:DUF429 domain-containing protein [Oharaeibacter diazotrophicus]|uniref:Putative RNase H-like nuclease n=1 Tax=Oharaeibacter diazotrophicus TaxID=1920512 RepID=A0A4R6R8E0_9HYPH|nr:DUF429 domain-containing protein [Oharaeibacter diazotrophicus]TDP81847.1 putative RNase H-like nuclease [Oharaeibacter diazotrophicus]BBE73479.1 hypothetical protein OHA_1_03092 [Pleomorphomonas sp. SM30]GLS75268.1 hypothetical protein GCM10007904_06030 [Oharaeibacter diazotrophicus]
MTVVAGVDGCPAGWIAVLRDLADGTATVRVVARLADLIATDDPAMIAVDMPIGLPDVVGPGGRAPERLVRPKLGMRQSSVFSVPARAAVYAEDYPAACAAALARSDPPRRVSKQCFHLFPKMRELDGLLRARPDLVERVRESHPEVAFAVLAGAPVTLPKKVKSRPNPDGLDERRRFLAGRGYAWDFLAAPPPRGAGPDDLLDAAVCALVAERVLAGDAVSHPAPPERDGAGLPIAIWT